MNEILVEEENTVYELDPECLRHKEEQRQLEEKRKQENKRMITIGCRRDQKKGIRTICGSSVYCYW